MKTQLLLSSLAFLSVSFASVSAAVFLTYDTVAGPFVPGVSSDSAITAGNIIRGPGLQVNSGGTFNSSSWDGPTDLAGAQAAGHYLEWSFTIENRFQVADTFVEFHGDRSGTGPQSIEVFYSTDGFATQIQILGQTDVGTSGTDQTTNTITELLRGTVAFRIYGYGATSAAGTFDLDPTPTAPTSLPADIGLQIDGRIIAPVPEPSTSALLALGLAGFLGRRRRA